MKKILSLFIITLLLSSCFWAQGNLDDAKKELWVINNNSTNTWVNSSTWTDAISVKDWGIEEIDNVDDSSDINIKSAKPTYSIEELTTEQFIELEDLSKKIPNIVDSIEIIWKTLTHIDKIVVNFVNRDSDYPIDKYTLSQFKPWDKTFVYRAKSQFKVLDYGLNEYVFEAYSWNEISKLQLNIFVPNPSDDEKTTPTVWDDSITYEKKLIWEDEEDQTYLSLPKSSAFGDPLSVWDTITYSNINSLEIKKEEVSSNIVNCSNLTDYLKTRISTWYYWNTCRDIVEDKGISYYVLKLSWDTYTYEKHYVDYNHGLYGIYIVKSGIEANNENIASDIALKNEELKNQNDSFSEVATVDSLFKEIVR